MTGFSATVTRENCAAICTDEFLDLRIEEGDLFGWFFLLQPIGRSPRPEMMVTAEQRALLRETVWRWREEDRPIFLGDFWNDAPLTGGCIAGGTYYFHIYGNGDISPCVFSPIRCGNVFDIIQGRSEYASLRDLVQRHPVFRAFREEQRKIINRARPCLLIDHPEVLRRLVRVEGCVAAKNMPPGYVDGEIARPLDQVAAEWAAKVPTLPPLPAERERLGGCSNGGRWHSVSTTSGTALGAVKHGQLTQHSRASALFRREVPSIRAISARGCGSTPGFR